MSESQTKLQKYSAPALEKGLDILEFLSLTDSAPSLSQLAVGIGRSKSEIFRMMIVLEERGYIERIQGDQFTLSSRLASLTANRPLNNKLAEIAFPILSELSKKTQFSSHLSVLNELNAIVIARANLATSYGLSVQIGHTFQLIDSSAGACFLAFQPNNEQPIANSQDILPKNSSKERFIKNIKHCKSNLWVTMPSPESKSICELSAPVLHLSGHATLAVVTIPYLASDQVSNRFTDMVKALLWTTAVLREKIGIIMPNIEIPSSKEYSKFYTT